MKTIFTVVLFSGFSLDSLSFSSDSAFTTLKKALKSVENYKTKFNLEFMEKKQEINMTLIYRHPETGCYYKFIVSGHIANVLFS